VCNNVNLKIEQNTIVALVGPSGCGKSSIMSLIERFYDPLSGEVQFSGTNIKNLDPRWLKKQISIVQQEPIMFSGTIKQNICYGLDMTNVR